MPKKKGGKKKRQGKKKATFGNETPGQVVKRFLRTYERNCLNSDTLICPGVRATAREHSEEDKILTKLIVEPVTLTSKDDPIVSLEPLLLALRQERYTYVTALHVWDLPLVHHNLASLALLLEKSVYTVHTLELMDCLIPPESIQRLSISFNACSSLTTISLDYNEFGDAGCEGLCRGLEWNRSILSLSLNYCDIGVSSGKHLGRVVCTTAVRELYLDGNDLLCAGVMEVIKGCVQKAEEEAFLREEDERLKAEDEALKALEAKERKRDVVSSAVSDGDDKPTSAGSVKGKKKKKKKGKKKKGPPLPPPVGPWIHKLHVADNGIDAYGDGGQLEPLVCVRLFRRLIAASKCLEELDLEDNLIGDLGGREILEALHDRKDAGLGGVKLRTTHRMNCDTFNSIVKLGAGLKKKKKKRGKKKKK